MRRSSSRPRNGTSWSSWRSTPAAWSPTARSWPRSGAGPPKPSSNICGSTCAGFARSSSLSRIDLNSWLLNWASDIGYWWWTKGDEEHFTFHEPRLQQRERLCHGNRAGAQLASSLGAGPLCRCGCPLPLRRCLCPEEAQRSAGDKVALHVEGIVGGGMHRLPAGGTRARPGALGDPADRSLGGARTVAGRARGAPARADVAALPVPGRSRPAGRRSSRTRRGRSAGAASGAAPRTGSPAPC